ncbi:MAG: transporter [Bacteroidetes bacterium GWF2_42_66]|nr:MAG: transporter [Bacteroidetes bacterium GWA2_42_15]OFX97676.1 MAG: transporter [Bacteroidetes bacterium GWE2_42_39]OFY46924.1 MAG: transporter [Bacteroidetes bacterium GWF2_42_66]HBL75713.1 transporter [Prolixibacteraceae bacterium]HCR91798.1 transporter [Prolixibacteraceae bacterium]
MTLFIILLGFLFGAILQSARLNRYNVISGMATLENLTVAKAIAVAIGVGAILINVEIGLGFASYHVKPFILGGIMLGGLIFGTGMAILGYCPGTMAISLGEGSLDALWGIIGGLLGGLIYTILLPSVQPILGPDLGSISLNSLLGSNPTVFYLLVFVIGAVFIATAFILNKIERKKDMTWLYAGIALAILNAVVFLSAVTDRVIGASTMFPYLADWLTGTTDNDYFTKIQKPGQWEVLFLGGAFVSGIIISLFRKEFKLRLIHDNWKKYKGTSSLKRIIWAIFGGFILIFGARMAGGCTSGHVISGGMQLAVSSLVFALFVFAGLLITGRLFYRKK